MDINVDECRCVALQSHFPQEVDFKCWFRLDLVK